MAGLTDGLALLRIPGLVRVRKASSIDFRQWLSSGTYEPTVGPAADLLLVRVDWDNYLSTLALDVDRFALAGRETLLSIRAVDGSPHACAWSLIKAYYSAFYYAHAILRLCSVAPSYFKTSELQPLIASCKSYGVTPPFPLKTSQYTVSSIPVDRSVSICKPTGSDGSHEALWKEFSTLLDRTSSILPSSSFPASERAEIDAELNDLKRAVRNAGGATQWLSALRNEVQYGQKLGVWYPYERSLGSAEVHRWLVRMLTTSTTTTDFDIGNASKAKSFLESCFMVCFAGRQLIADLAKSQPGSFLRARILRYENALRAA
jgi:hypothetical protein